MRFFVSPIFKFVHSKSYCRGSLYVRTVRRYQEIFSYHLGSIGWEYVVIIQSRRGPGSGRVVRRTLRLRVFQCLIRWVLDLPEWNDSGQEDVEVKCPHVWRSVHRRRKRTIPSVPGSSYRHWVPSDPVEEETGQWISPEVVCGSLCI